ncbi:MAG: putative lipid II flippase FtsW [Deltaproteobacteria bacterium]|nr:putative lipid II flippase FtsW [Deltaproteobacteria bacterium]
MQQPAAVVARKATASKPLRFDAWILFAVLGLMALGLVMVYSASAVAATSKLGDGFYYLKRQLMAAGVGLGTLILFMKLGYKRLAPLTYVGLFGTFVLLVAVLIPHVGYAAGGAQRWIRFPGISIQPAEIAKLALVLYLAYSLAKKRDKVKSFSIGFLPHCAVTGLMVLLCLKEKDFGTSVALVVILFAMLFAAGAKISYLVGSILLAIPIGYHQIASSPYRMNRMIAFMDPWAHRHDVGYQVAESLMSVGSGGLWGAGLGESKQKLFFLPEAHTDFIFSIVGEELGLIGVLAVLGLFGILIWRGMRATLNASDPFGAYLALGITVLFGFQALVNIGVTLGVLPTKGLTLPFISYGGCSLVVCCAAAGILLSISGSTGGFLRPQGGSSR